MKHYHFKLPKQIAILSGLDSSNCWRKRNSLLRSWPLKVRVVWLLVSDHFYIYDDFMFTPISWSKATFSTVIYVLYSWYGLRDIIPLFLWDLIFAYGWIIVVCGTNIFQLLEHDSTYMLALMFHPIGTHLYNWACILNLSSYALML